MYNIKEDPQLKAVRKAITQLTGFTHIHIKRSPHRMIIVKHCDLDEAETPLEVNQLSDGEKCLLALVGDLARRLSLANPGKDDPLEAEAVVLIDEIELHLHPKWQQKVIGDLIRTFPNCQFIVTTHSPLVLSSVKAENIYLLDGKKAIRPSAATKGRDSNAVLSEVMGVSERPKEIIDRLDEISLLIDSEQFSTAREKINSLAAVLSEKDSEIVRFNALMGFLGEEP